MGAYHLQIMCMLQYLLWLLKEQDTFLLCEPCVSSTRWMSRLSGYLIPINLDIKWDYIPKKTILEWTNFRYFLSKFYNPYYVNYTFIPILKLNILFVSIYSTCDLQNTKTKNKNKQQQQKKPWHLSNIFPSHSVILKSFHFFFERSPTKYLEFIELFKSLSQWREVDRALGSFRRPAFSSWLYNLDPILVI